MLIKVWEKSDICDLFRWLQSFNYEICYADNVKVNFQTYYHIWNSYTHKKIFKRLVYIYIFSFYLICSCTVYFFVFDSFIRRFNWGCFSFKWTFIGYYLLVSLNILRLVLPRNHSLKLFFFITERILWNIFPKFTF